MYTCLFEKEHRLCDGLEVVAGLVQPWTEGGQCMLQRVFFFLISFPILAKECADILFSLPHPWLTLGEESKELNYSHPRAPCLSGAECHCGSLPLERVLWVFLGSDPFGQGMHAYYMPTLAVLRYRLAGERMEASGR